MKSDIDRLMGERGLDGIFVFGGGSHNPAMVYLTGGGHFSHAMCIKKVNEPAILVHDAMEREEAQQTGLVTINLSNYPISRFIETTPNNDPYLANAYRRTKVLQDIGFDRGNVAIYGRVDLETNYYIINQMTGLLPEMNLVRPSMDDVLSKAMVTKDEIELNRIKRMGHITTEVVGLVQDYLSTRSVRGGTLYQDNETPLTVGYIKRKINLWLAERGAENPHGTIFALGRDAGIPHSSGHVDDLVRTGLPIVFDIYPCEAGGGYHYDFTRTWCLGHAPDEVSVIYEDVYYTYRTICEEIKPQTPFSMYQRRVCEMFSEKGHPTVLDSPETEDGYVHSLGHGVGLNIHERPSSSMVVNNGDELIPGVVITIEPGLYYPDRGMGVRIEDTYFMDDDGKLHPIVTYPHDLIIPVKD